MVNARLITENNLPDPDAAFRMIIEAHRGFTDDESKALNAKLVLIFANQIGDLTVLEEALALAKQE
jgi:hypothetical protein